MVGSYIPNTTTNRRHVNTLLVGGRELTDRDWHLDALCTQTDPELWFPDTGEHAIEAKKICHQCPAQHPCREQAIRDYEPYGIWGGTSPKERRQIRTQRRHRQQQRGIA